MKTRYTLLAACTLCLGLAACGDSALVAPESPSHNGGSTIGSGNRADSATVRSGLGFGSGNRIEDPTVTTATADGTTERSGHTYGSGN